MPALLVFVTIVVVVGGGLIVFASLVGSRRRAQGRQFDGHVRGFGKR
jgi:hypothetical protein